MNGEAEKGVQEVEGEIHKRTGVSSTGLRLKNEDRSRCIRLYYRGSFIYGV